MDNDVGNKNAEILSIRKLRKQILCEYDEKFTFKYRYHIDEEKKRSEYKCKNISKEGRHVQVFTSLGGVIRMGRDRLVRD